MRDLYIHEDELGLVFLDLAANYVAYPGNTWDLGNAQVYSPADDRVRFESLRLAAADVELLVSRYFPAYDAVLTGYSSHREPLGNTAAFGHSDRCVVLVSRSEDGKLAGISFVLYAPPMGDQLALLALLKKLAGIGDFILEGSNFQCRLDNDALLQLYFASEFGLQPV